MAAMDKALFTGGDQLAELDLQQAIVHNFATDTAAALKRFGWDGTGACCAIGLNLGVDNDEVEKAVFLVRGPLEKQSIMIEAHKIWPGASKEAALALKFAEAGLFTFPEGGLASDFVAQELVSHSFYMMNGDGPATMILEQDYEEHGIKGFSVRMMAVISKNSSGKNGVIMKVTVLLYPEEKAVMMQKYEAAGKPEWPGLRILESHLPLIPRPQQAWGCPVVPLLLFGTPLDVNPTVPPAAAMRRAVAFTMGTAVAPETCKTGNAVANKWDKLKNNPELMVAKKPDVGWPAPEVSTERVGKIPIYI